VEKYGGKKEKIISPYGKTYARNAPTEPFP